MSLILSYIRGGTVDVVKTFSVQLSVISRNDGSLRFSAEQGSDDALRNFCASNMHR